jgi:hypothetical protein
MAMLGKISSVLSVLQELFARAIQHVYLGTN